EQSSCYALTSDDRCRLFYLPQCRTSPPHETTHFPYTTLFRSCCRRHGPNLHPECLLQHPLLRPQATEQAGHSVDHVYRPRSRPRDRKSTRLNSSHLGNSYAVFCLKKKKKITRSRPRSTESCLQ